MTNYFLILYDNNYVERKLYIKNAYDIKYTNNYNTLSTASFMLPYSDSQNKQISQLDVIEIWDFDSELNRKLVGSYRVVNRQITINSGAKTVSYTLEHILGFLTDDLIHDKYTSDGTKDLTVMVNEFLSKQTTVRWQLGQCDLTGTSKFEYTNQNILYCILGLMTSIEVTDDTIAQRIYYFTFDIETTPWTFNILLVPTEATVRLLYSKDIVSYTSTSSNDKLVTRLYCYGKTVDNIVTNIASVNNGLTYIDSENINKYGIISRIYTDNDEEDATKLLQKGKQYMSTYEEVYVSYTIDVIFSRPLLDCYAGQRIDFIVDGEVHNGVIITITKNNLSNNIYDGTLTINAIDTLQKTVGDVQSKSEIDSAYAQGAEAVIIDSFREDASTDYPCEIAIYIPRDTRRVINLYLYAQITAPRATSRAIGGGGAQGTTESAGEDWGQTDESSSVIVTTDSWGGIENGLWSSSSGEEHIYTSIYDMPLTVQYQYPSEENTKFVHNHGIPKGTRLVTDIHPVKNAEGYITSIKYDYTTWVPSGAHGHGSHLHSVNLSNHVHKIYIPEHTHTYVPAAHAHTFTLGGHEHIFYTPDHTHQHEFGIWEGSSPSASCSVYLDDVLIKTYTSSINGDDLISYLQTNAEGNIDSGTHTIKITPSGACRVEGALEMHLFTRGDL